MKKVLVIDGEQIVLNSVKKVFGQGDYDVESTLSAWGAGVGAHLSISPWANHPPAFSRRPFISIT